MSLCSSAERRLHSGGNWIITYCDVVTLLMAFFICVIAFAWKGEEQFSPASHCPPDGAVVWRPRLPPPRESATNEELAPLYQDPSAEMSARILQTLEAVAPSRLTDNFTVRLPLNLLFDEGEHLSPSGARLLRALADHLRDLPYDLQFQVSRSEQLPQAIQLCGFLAAQERYEPARLAAGIVAGTSAAGTQQADAVWLVLFPQT